MINSETKHKRLLLVFTLVILLFGGLGIWSGMRLSAPVRHSDIALQAGTQYPEPRDFGSFQLLDASGAQFGPERWQGQWRLVFFGFTFCPDICPTTMTMLGQLRKQLPEGQRPIVTFVSVDPERDTPERIGDYARYFDPSFEAATGSPDLLEDLTRRMGIVFHIEDHEAGDMDYAVDHSAAILLLNPSGRIHAVFTAPHDPEAMARDIIALQQGGDA
jgi:protein SCO1/2